MWSIGPVRLLDEDETITIERQGTVVGTDVSYVDGVAIMAHPPEVFTLPGTLQPLDGRDLSLLPEAFRERETYNLWVRHVSEAHSLKPMDIVSRESKRYQVQSTEQWGNYTKAVIVALDVGIWPQL